jgi:GntR family transcriptional repressor for pyruvate dehydrogenase complex
MNPLPSESLVERVVERIRAVIEGGELRPGDRLPTEFELVSQFQVSRSVLREAIGRLQTLGVLEVRHGRGMFVGEGGSLKNCAQLLRSAMTIAPKDLAQLAELRRGLELQAARLAAQRASAEDIAELQAICEQMDREDAEYLESVQLDCRFHQKLVASTRNELMRNIFDVVSEFMAGGMVQTTPQPRNRKASRGYHLPIVAAIAARDPDAAEQAMRTHMDAVDRAVQEIESGQKRN